MNVTNKLPGVRNQPSLPVSIPIHIYHKTLQKASANSGFKNMSKQEMTKPVENPKRKEHTSKHNDQRENSPKQANMVNENRQSTDKSTFTDPPSVTNESLINTLNGVLANPLLFMVFTNFINSLKQKLLTTRNENKSTQTDDVPVSHEDKINNEQEDKASNKELNAKSKDTQSNKAANVLKEVEYLNQEYKNFYIELNSSTRRLFEENPNNNELTFKYSQATRGIFLNISKALVDLITRQETENATDDLSSGASVAGDIVNLEVENDDRESSENIMPSMVNNNNNKEASHTKTQTAQNIMQHNDFPEVQEVNHTQREQINMEQNDIEEYVLNPHAPNPHAPNPHALNPHALSPQTFQAPQTAITVNHSNETPYEYHQRSNALNTQMHFNNIVNPQSVSRYTRPQILQQQLLNNGGYIDYQNKIYRYSGKNNVRSTPYNTQKPQKRKMGQPGQQQQGMEAPFQNQHGYYPANQQQFIQQPITYQQNLH